MFFREADQIPEGEPFDYVNGEITGLILARGGSKGVPLKNVKMLAGKPLLAWSLTAMQDSGVFDKIYVSTDHDSIAKVARDHGAEVYMRDPEYAADTTSSVASMQEFLYKHNHVEAICLVLCTSPCVQPFHFQEAVTKYRHYHCDSVFSVKRQKSYRWNFESGGTLQPANFTLPNKIEKSNWEGELYENGAMYLTHRSNIKMGELQHGKCMYYEMKQQFNTDIDTEHDFIMAETIVKKYGYRREGEDSQS